MFHTSLQKKFTQAQQGEALIILGALLWSFFPIVSILSFSTLAPLMSAALATLFAALFFAAVLSLQRQWRQLLVRAAWKDTLLATVLNGILFYGLVFTGLEYTTAGNASIILLMEVFFSFVILNLWKKETLVASHVIGAVCMVGGALLILFPGTLQVNRGDIFLLTATAVPPFGNYFSQVARKKISTAAILFVRSVISGIFLLALALVLGYPLSMPNIVLVLPILAFNGIVLMGFDKILWLEAIHRITITKAISLSSVTPAFTLLFAYFLLNETVTAWQIASLVPIMAGVILLTSFKKIKVAPPEQNV